MEKKEQVVGEVFGTRHWKAALLTCCSRAARMGGIRSTEDFFAKSFFLALLMSVQVLVQS